MAALEVLSTIWGIKFDRIASLRKKYVVCKKYLNPLPCTGSSCHLKMVAKLAVVSLAMVCSSAVAFVPGAKLNAGVRARGRVQMSVVSPSNRPCTGQRIN